MYDAPQKLGERYAQFVGPLINERFILRFEIEIHTDRHFITPQIRLGAWTAEIPIHAPQKGACGRDETWALANALPYLQQHPQVR